MSALLLHSRNIGASSLVYDPKTNGYIMYFSDSSNLTFFLLSGLKTYARAIEWEYEASPGSRPPRADYLVGVSEDLTLLKNDAKYCVLAPGCRYRIDIDIVEELRIHAKKDVILRLRLEWARSGHVDTTLPFHLVAPFVIIPRGEFASMEVDWPPLTDTSCEQNAIWLREPRRSPKAIAEMLSVLPPSMCGPLSVEPADGGIWVRGLKRLGPELNQIITTSSINEYSTKIKLDTRGLGEINCLDRDICMVAVSAQIVLYANLCLGRFLPLCRYRVPLTEKIVVKGAPDTAVCVRVQCTYSGSYKESPPSTFANADGDLFEHEHGIYRNVRPIDG